MPRLWATFIKTPNSAKYKKENIKMEVINFKTKHEINQTVYIVNNGIILETKVKGVLFTEAPYQYKLLDKNGGVFFVYEEDVSGSIEQAIEKAVLQHKEKL